ncbi:MAG: hypothetical protein DRN90_03640 [Thermoproteota archaeon]|nr:MAG: hypothetical protein DRN90_03640 [Candidatus Korarchaeota archaeon]RLG48833.1 MAG: hypothetical protein DRN92_00100 [Candidatus Korarchaeota archaeon]
MRVLWKRRRKLAGKEKEIEKMLKQGKSIRAIARELGVHHEAIRKFIKKTGLKSTSLSRQAKVGSLKSPPVLDPQDLIIKHIGEGKNPSDIAALLKARGVEAPISEIQSIWKDYWVKWYQEYSNRLKEDAERPYDMFSFPFGRNTKS